MRIIGLTKDMIGFAVALHRLPKQIEADRRALPTRRTTAKHPG